jgi:hypothetical protein
MMTTRPEAVARLVLRHSLAIGAQRYAHIAVTSALRALEDGHTAHRAVRRGVIVAEAMVDGCREDER